MQYAYPTHNSGHRIPSYIHPALGGFRNAFQELFGFVPDYLPNIPRRSQEQELKLRFRKPPQMMLSPSQIFLVMSMIRFDDALPFPVRLSSLNRLQSLSHDLSEWFPRVI